MKINRRNPLHWLYLILAGLWVVTAVPLRLIYGATDSRRVLLYGHKLGGNLLALERYLRRFHPDVEVAFLVLDPAYFRELKNNGERVVLATSPRCISWLVKSFALVSDHGLHTLRLMLHLTDMKFYDVWHGIPFKGFDADDFQVQHKYDGVWVASDLMRELYIQRFGFRPEIVQVTGYARTDQLTGEAMDTEATMLDLGLDPNTCGKLILFAPTWQQDSAERSPFPFGLEPHVFLSALSRLAVESNATVLLRLHLNSESTLVSGMERVVLVPYARFPDTERILLASDVLVCDWSSIAFDFLLLNRPALFLDVAAPFRKGFSLGPEFRYGALARDLEELTNWLESILRDTTDYWHNFGDSHRNTRQLIYGEYADGNSASRCAERLLS